MIFVTETWIFDEPIQHFLAKVFVLKVIGISYFFVKQGYDLEVQLVVQLLNAQQFLVTPLTIIPLMCDHARMSGT